MTVSEIHFMWFDKEKKKTLEFSCWERTTPWTLSESSHGFLIFLSKRIITNRYFSIDDIRICCLHTKQRIIEKLLKISCFGRSDVREEINRIIKDYFKINGVELTEKDLRNWEDCCVAHIGMMDANKADLITNNGEELILKLKHWAISKSVANPVIHVDFLFYWWDDLRNIWKDWLYIKNIIESDTENLKKVNLGELDTKLRSWIPLIVSIFGGFAVNYYMHIISVHLVELLKKGNLTQLSNEGFKNSHQYQKQGKITSTSQGGGVEHINPKL